MASRHARLRAVLAVGAAAIALSAPAAESPAAQEAGLATATRAHQPASEVREYWTAARMRAAEPIALRIGSDGLLRVDSPRQAPGRPLVRSEGHARGQATDTSASSAAFPERVHGKVFFTIDGGSEPGDYRCSGTVVDSFSHALVWTAGHCVNDAEFGGGFATNWIFVPGYRDGEHPYGSWPGRRLFTTRPWALSANTRFDLGAARLARDEEGRGVEDVVGARGIAFNQPRHQAFTAFGYPSVPTLFRPEFNGERLFACVSGRAGDDYPPGGGPPTLEIECDMSAGASGGGWVTDEGFVNSVTSYGYVGDPEHLYGPYQGTTAERLYLEARGPQELCGAREVTNLGGPGRDDFLGTDGGDAIELRGGRDRARGGGGRDRLCGGGGRDVLRGGPGRDVCFGGGGRDRAPGCEARVDVP